jgi:hypothetical protein
MDCGVMKSSPDDFDRGDEIITGGVMISSCFFCKGVMKSSPNKQEAYKQENNTRARDDRVMNSMRIYTNDRWRCEKCGMLHASAECPPMAAQA